MLLVEKHMFLLERLLDFSLSDGPVREFKTMKPNSNPSARDGFSEFQNNLAPYDVPATIVGLLRFDDDVAYGYSPAPSLFPMSGLLK